MWISTKEIYYLQLVSMKTLLLFLLFLLFSCNNRQPFKMKKISEKACINWDVILGDQKPICYYESLMKKYGLVDLKSIVPEVIVDLRYATTNNFTGKNLYGCLKKAYVHPELAISIKKAQQILNEIKPGYRLIIYDAARPLQVQKILSDHLQMPSSKKWKYLSNPARGSLHNYGLAIDVSIVDENNNELDMGTPYDFFGPEAEPIHELELLKQGKLTSKQIENRKLLRKIMRAANLQNIPTEWWHFQLMTRNQAELKYKLIR